MLLRSVCLLFLIGISLSLKAQDSSVAQVIKEIDSLIQYNQLEIAERKADSLKAALEKSFWRRKDKATILELEIRRAILLEKRDFSSLEPLTLLLGIIDEAEKENLHSLACRIYLRIALAYEKVGENNLNEKYLRLALQKIRTHKLDHLYSAYYIRKCVFHRNMEQRDSILHYAKLAKHYSEKYNNQVDLKDSHLFMIYTYVRERNYDEALKYGNIVLNFSKNTKDSVGIALEYNNIAVTYLDKRDFPKALNYSDSAFVYYRTSTDFHKSDLSVVRYRIFDGMGNVDSAFYYFKQFHNNLQAENSKEERIRTKKLEEQYQNDKKEITIRNKDRQMLLIGSLLVVILFSSVLLYRKNNKISKQNVLINSQLGELTKSLHQKQVLLSELQHRVKNNLQHIISILELQKDSVTFNNIEELIRGNQNRIHSIALIHNRLNLSDDVNEVDLKQYILELSTLVKDAYFDEKKDIQFQIVCEVGNMRIEKALPIGLIITELISNSLKHAFKKRKVGMINISITQDAMTKLYYRDNGPGFDFNSTSGQGLGLEIIKGLIDQLEGKLETSSEEGFRLTCWFK